MRLQWRKIYRIFYKKRPCANISKHRNNSNWWWFDGQDGRDCKKLLSDVKYIYQENKGVSEARNTGLRHCSGNYIAWLDADDLYLPDKIKEQVDFLQQNKDIDCVYNDAFLIDAHDNLVKVLRSDYGNLAPNDFLAQLLFRQTIPVRQVPCIEESVLKTCVLFPAWGMRKIIGAASNWSKIQMWIFA